MRTAKHLAHGITRYAAGETIVAQGDPSRAIYEVARGRVRLEVLDEQGRREVVAFLFSGDILCAGLSWNWASATALSSCELRAFQIRGVMGVAERNVCGATSILKTLEFQLNNMAQHLTRICKTDARARLWWFMCWLATRSEATPRFELPPRADIADFLGMAPETISRLLQSMEDEGLIRRFSDRRCEIVVKFQGQERAPALC